MKKLLFVINTLSRAGAETALLELLRRLDPARYDISLFVLTSQGELAKELPPYVRLLNTDYDDASVLCREGKRKLIRLALRSMCVRGTALRLFPYLIRNLWEMLRRGSFSAKRLLWRVLSDGAPRWEESYDLAVACLEGGSTYYVADHVKAAGKAAFVHIDYTMAGYGRRLDRDCYQRMDQIFAVSEEVRARFLEVYPEHRHKVEVFHNILDVPGIREKALLPGGFSDGYGGTRLLTIGRLTAQKAYEVSIEAMKLLKDAGGRFRWYVLGEGDQRGPLERKLRALGLTEDFVLCGAVENPYPYLAQADLYVHASRFEGKSVALQEAQIMGCAILASDCSGNRENVSDGVDGKLCPLTPEGIRDGILWLIEHPRERKQYAGAAERKYREQRDGAEKLLALAKGNGG